jgi:hypothetical protein
MNTVAPFSALELIPTLRSGTPEERIALLNRLDAEQVKALAKEVCGMKRVAAGATKNGLMHQIVTVLSAAVRLAGELPAIGDVVTDEDSGEAVKITLDMKNDLSEISDDLDRAHYSIQRGMVDIARAVRSFKGKRLYLVLGYRSFRAYCDAGHLKLLGETRSRKWAEGLIRTIELLGEDALTGLGHLPRRQVLKLTSALTASGMESQLEELKDKLVLRYTDDDGEQRELALPKTKEEAAAWSEVIRALHKQASASRRAMRAAEDDLLAEKEIWAKERGEYDAEIRKLEAGIAEASGLTDDLEEQLAKAKGLTPEQIVKLQALLEKQRKDKRDLEKDLRLQTERADELAQAVEARRAQAALDGQIKRARAACDGMLAAWDSGVEAIGELRANALDLPRPARRLVYDLAATIESQARELANEFTDGEEV